MTYVAGSVKLVFAGTTQGGEKFAHTFWVDMGSAPSQADLEACVSQAKLTFDSVVGITSVKALYPTTTTYNTVVGYSYAGGPLVDKVSSVYTLATFAGTGSNALPDQCAVVVSLRTGIPGRSYRGRSYLPAVAAGALASTGQFGSSGITTLGNAWKAWMQGVAAGGAGFPATPVIVASATRGLKTHVTNFQIDSRLDVQRRRADKQAATVLSTFTL